jgi:hypothetical protein
MFRRGILESKSVTRFEIILTTNTNRPVMISPEDYEVVCRFRWFEKRSAAVSYVARSIKRNGKVQTLRLHRFIGERAFGPQPSGTEFHHRDRDTFNMVRSNIEPLPRSAHRQLHARMQ